MKSICAFKWPATVLFLLLLQSCATRLYSPEQSAARIAVLSKDIRQLSNTITAEEANRFAKAAVETSAALGRKYEVELIPWLHNASIHVGLKDRGLCFEYARDLYASLKFVQNEHLAMHFVQANKGKLNEHHALVVTVKGAPWETGILLDAWRGSGNLFTTQVKADRYPWEAERRDASFVSVVSNDP